MHVAVERLKEGDHAAYIYDDHEEKFNVCAGFFGKALKLNEKCLFIVHEQTVKKSLEYLTTAGFDTDHAAKNGSFSVLRSDAFYYSNGRFDPDRLVYSLKELVAASVKEGYAGLRVAGEMSWALDNVSGSERLMEYESRLNYLVPKSHLTALCMYNQEKFAEEFLINAVQTHPVVLYKWFKRKNPYYMAPDEFLVSESIGITSDYFSEKMHKKGKQVVSGSDVREKFQKSLQKYSLTRQEQRVVEQILQFKSNKEIADALFISVNTVKQHIKNLFRKIGIHNRIELISLFMKKIDDE